MAKEVTAGVEQHSVDQAESAQVEECVTVAQTSAACEARVAAVYDMAQVVASAPLPSYLDVVRLVGDQRLEDDVLRDFDPASHLFELSSSWVSLMMEASSFGEKLQVSSLCPSVSFMFLVWCLLLSSSSYLLFSSFEAYSWNYSSFSGSGEAEKKLASKVDFLKVELASRHAELEVERQGR